MDPIVAAGFDAIQPPPVALDSWPMRGEAPTCYREFLRMEKQMNWLASTFDAGSVRINVGGSNNMVAGGNISHSPAQQGTSGTAAQSTTFCVLSNDDLRSLVEKLSQHLAELRLSPEEERKVRAQLATIDAQLADEPNMSIVREAGKSIRAVTEGAIGGLLANAAQPTVWGAIGSILASF